jgi:hypothetical protein
MHIGRTILTFLVALSLTMAPMAGAFALQNDEVAASSEAVASAHACCPDEGMPASPATNECHASAGCLAKCFSFHALEFSGATLPAPIGGTKSYFASGPIHSHTASPPFRPPRV